MMKIAFALSFALALALASAQAHALTRITDLFINTSVVNVTDQLCLGLACVTSWPVNTTDEMFAAVDNKTFHRYSGTMSLSNVTDPADCAAGQFVYGKSGFSWVCRADLFNTTAQIQAAQLITGNTTNQIFAAVDNGTFHRFSQQLTWANLSSWSLNNVWTGSLGWNNMSARSLDIIWLGGLAAGNITTGTLANARLDGKVYLINSTGLLASNITTGTLANARLDTKVYLINNSGLSAANITTGTLANARLDGKIHFINNTVQLLTAGNLTTSTINATHLVADLGLGWENLTAYPAACGANQRITAIGDTLTCANDLFNTTAQVQAAQTVNTSAQVNAAMNSTFTGQLGKNTTAEIQAAQKITGNTSAEVLAIAVSRLDWTTHDSYPTACSANQFVTTLGDTLTCSADLFNTTVQIQAAQTVNTTAEVRAAQTVNTTAQVQAAQLRGANVSTTACGGTDKVSGIDNSTGAVTCTADQVGAGAAVPLSAYIFKNNTAIVSLNESFPQLLNASLSWTNVTDRSLNIVWANTIGWGNVSLRSLDIIWTNGGLGAGNITTGTIMNARLDSKVYMINNTGMLAANITSGTLRSSLLGASVFQINGTTRLTQGNLSSTFSILNANVSVTTDFSMGLKNITAVNNVTFGTANAWVYWNGTCLITKGTTSRVEVC